MNTTRKDDEPAGFGGPGYSGFGGSAGYNGAGVGGISGGYAGGGYTDGNWQAPAETRHDDGIQNDARNRLALNQEVDASDIEVSVEAGQVTLQGSVPTRHMKAVAAEVAEGVPGVHAVRNQLHVSQPFVDELKELLSFDPPHNVKR